LEAGDTKRLLEYCIGFERLIVLDELREPIALMRSVRIVRRLNGWLDSRFSLFSLPFQCLWHREHAILPSRPITRVHIKILN